MPTTKKAKTLYDLLLHKLMALYDVEDEILKTLPRVIKKVHNENLQAALEIHLQETKDQVGRLEECFSLLDAKAKKLKVEAIRALAEDGAWVMEHVVEGPALDANLIAAVQYVEHYEIAGYGTAIAWADLMGHAEVADILGETLDEEMNADEKLTHIAETEVNTLVETGM